MKEQHFHYFSFDEPTYSRAGVLSQGLLDHGCDVIFTQFERSFMGILKNSKNVTGCSKFDCKTIVPTPSQSLIVYFRIFERRKVIFDAGWSLTESFLSNNHMWNIPKLIKIYCLDFMAFHLAKKILVESNSQKNFISKYFFIKQNKIFVSYTGFNETKIRFATDQIPKECASLDLHKKLILFRGKRNNEAGFSSIAALTREKILGDFHFLIVSNKDLSDLEWGKNVTLIVRTITESEMNWCYKKATASLGQISTNPRVRNTIPHKTFEALFYNIPIITTLHSSTFDLLGSEGCIYWDSNSGIVRLAEILKSNIDDERVLAKIKISNEKKYLDELSQQAITKNFLSEF